MMKTRSAVSVLPVVLCLATAALGREPSFEEHAAVQESLARVTGDYVSLAKLKLFQIEEETGGNGGVQSLGSDWTFVTRLRGCSPNPFAKGTSVNYELARYGPVELTVHDVSGRLVRRL